MRAGKISAGTETVIADLKKRKIRLLVLASDLHENSSEKVIRAAKQAEVKIVQDFSSQELAKAIGKKRKVIGLKDVGFAKALTKQIKEGV